MLSQKIKAYFDKQGGLDGKTLAVWGLAFKANTDDVRESAALKIIRNLAQEGITIKAYDPEAGPNTEKKLSDLNSVEICNDQYSVLTDADALAVITDWNQFCIPDFTRIKKLLKNPLIFDGRNLYADSYLTDLGFHYFGIGRPHLTPAM